MCSRKVAVEQEAVHDGHNTEIESKRMKKEKVSDPILCETREHLHQQRKKNTTSRTFRSWCLACVHGKARDKHHRRDQSEKDLPEVVFDCCFLGAEGEEESLSRFKWRLTVGPA